MSADLFAEFNNESNSAPSQSSNNPAGRASQPQPHAQTSWPQDPFGFGSGSNVAPAQQPQSAQQWPAFQGSTQSNSLSGWDQISQPAQSFTSPQQADEDNGWGDFEVADTSNVNQTLPSAAAPSSISRPSGPSWGSYDSSGAKGLGPTSSSFRAPAQHRTGSALVGTDPPAYSQPTHSDIAWDQAKPKPKVQVKAAATKDPNVLFDAEDFELRGGEDLDGNFQGDFDDDDDFGDFEAVSPSQPTSAPATGTRQVVTQVPALPQPKPSVSTVSASLDLLGLVDTSETAPPLGKYTDTLSRPPNAALSFGTIASSPPVSQTTSHQTQNTFQDLWSEATPATTSPLNPKLKAASKSTSATTSAKKQPSISKKPAVVKETAEDDEWAAWDDPPPATSNNKAASQTPTTSEDWGWGADDTVEPPQGQSSDTDPPPMNVPPPSVLLTAFPELLNSGNALFKPVAGQGASIKEQVLSNPKTAQFLKGYVLLATTAAHVIAGRKHRWHRDKILAKSMSISAAGSKGMKLAGVDKMQSAREDREAADVVAAWQENIGRLRSAVAAVNTTGKTNLKVPELTGNPQIQTAKLVPTAPKACIICGLKREERVAKVDYEVEDSFGEWWVDHWGHRACKNFWVEHEQRLRQR